MRKATALEDSMAETVLDLLSAVDDYPAFVDFMNMERERLGIAAPCARHK